MSAARERFEKAGGHEDPDPIERLRFFCSQAMGAKYWLDVERFFDDVIAERASLHTRLDALAAQLAELEGQEPIGEVTHSDVLPNAEEKYRHEFVSDFRIGVQAELYARPVPAEPHHKHAAPWLGWALHIIRERCPDVVTSHQFERAEDAKKACFAEGLDQAPAEPVNARLLEALKRAKDSLVAFKFLPGDANRWEASDEENLAAVNSAIAAAEPASKAVRLTAPDIVDALRGNGLYEDSRAFQRLFPILEADARAIEIAALRKNGIEVAE